MYAPSDSYPAQGNRDLLAKAQKPHIDTKILPADEDIANVVADVRKGRVTWHTNTSLAKMAYRRFKEAQTVVDATAIYDGLINDQNLGKAVRFYEDHPCIAPPWEHALIAYQNGHGNILVMECTAEETDRTPQWDVKKRVGNDDPPVEWERVRWTIDAIVWVGGQDSEGHRIGTMGPVHMWRLAVYEDGEPADLSWLNLSPDYPMELWDMAHATLLGSLNFMNCRNVEIVEPQRPRAEARRIARTGVKVSTLNVFPIGKSSRSAPGEGKGVPLTSVRGSFATYGPEYGKGLLFGKYEGRFWRPQHARGEKEHGESNNNYRLRTD